MHAREKHFLTGIIVTGDDATPAHERIAPMPMPFRVPEVDNSLTGEVYIPTPYIVSYISGHYMRQYMQYQPQRTA